MTRSGLLSVAVVLALVGGCAAAEAERKGAEYGVALERCNRVSTTLCASIACENIERADAGRPARALPTSCRDAGAPAPEGGAK